MPIGAAGGRAGGPPTREPLAPASDAAGAIVFRQGGSAANTARWIARLGGEAAFVGAVGRDEGGRRLGGSLGEAGVRVHLVRRAGRTARIVALVEPGGERTFITDRGAADQLTPEDLRGGPVRRAPRPPRPPPP